MRATSQYAQYPSTRLRDGTIRVDLPPHVQQARASLDFAHQIIAGSRLQCEFPEQHASACQRLDTAINALIDAMTRLREGGAA